MSNIRIISLKSIMNYLNKMYKNNNIPQRHLTTLIRYSHDDTLPENLKRRIRSMINKPIPVSRNSPFEKFVNRLLNITSNNRNLSVKIINNSKRKVKLAYRNGTFVNYIPSGNKRGVELEYGRTRPDDRGKGLGTRLRTYGIRAAKAAGVPLWQYGSNINKLVPENEPPISTRIMRKHGAVWTRGIPNSFGKIQKVNWGSLVRGHRYPIRKPS